MVFNYYLIDGTTYAKIYLFCASVGRNRTRTHALLDEAFSHQFINLPLEFDMLSGVHSIVGKVGKTKDYLLRLNQ